MDDLLTLKVRIMALESQNRKQDRLIRALCHLVLEAKDKKEYNTEASKEVIQEALKYLDIFSEVTALTKVEKV